MLIAVITSEGRAGRRQEIVTTFDHEMGAFFEKCLTGIMVQIITGMSEGHRKSEEFENMVRSGTRCIAYLLAHYMNIIIGIGDDGRIEPLEWATGVRNDFSFWLCSELESFITEEQDYEMEKHTYVKVSEDEDDDTSDGMILLEDLLCAMFEDSGSPNDDIYIKVEQV